MPVHIRDDLVEGLARAICQALEAAGLSPQEQLVCLGAVEAIALAKLPPAERARARWAHEKALDVIADDNSLVEQ